MSARCAVERCIGLLKARFRCLLRHRVLEYAPEKAGRIVNACAILHNMCVKARVPDPPELPVVALAAEVDNEIYQPGQDPMPEGRNILREARLVRDNIIRRLP